MSATQGRSRATPGPQRPTHEGGATIQARQCAGWSEIDAVLPAKAAITAMLAGEYGAAEIPDAVLVEYIHFLEGQLHAAGNAVAYRVAAA